MYQYPSYSQPRERERPQFHQFAGSSNMSATGGGGMQAQPAPMQYGYGSPQGGGQQQSQQQYGSYPANAGMMSPTLFSQRPGGYMSRPGGPFTPVPVQRPQYNPSPWMKRRRPAYNYGGNVQPPLPYINY